MVINNPGVLLDVTFWILLNLVILGVIISLILYRYHNQKQTKRAEALSQQGSNKVEHIVGLFEKHLKVSDTKAAVTLTFKSVMEELGANRYPHLTYFEILHHNLLRLDSYELNILRRMYLVYERYRFSNADPDVNCLTSFRENLYELIRSLRERSR